MILISGEALIDLIPDPVKANAYDAVLGGSPYNVAIGLAPARLADRLRLADLRRRQRRRAGRRPRWQRRRPSVSSCATSGRRRSLLSCAARRKPARAIPSISTRRRLTAHGLSRRHGRKERTPSACRLDLPRSTAARRGGRRGAQGGPRANATVSYDPNIRPLVTPDRDVGRRSSSSGRPPSPISSRRARKTSSGSIPAGRSRTALRTGRSGARVSASRPSASGARSPFRR